MSSLVNRFLLPLAAGGVLGTSVVLISSKAVVLLVGGIVFALMAIVPELAYYAIVATLQVAVEVGGGLTISRVIIPIAVFLMVINALAGRSPWPMPLFWPESYIALAFFFWIGISILLVDNPGEVAREAAGLIVMPVLFFCTLAFVQDRRSFDRLVWVLVLTGVAQAVFTIIQYKTGISLGGDWRASQIEGEAYRAEGTSTHPILLAGFLQIVIAMTVMQIICYRNLYMRVALIAGLGALLVAWYLTYARSSWIGMSVFLYVALAVSSRAGRNIAILIGVVGIVVIIVARNAPDVVLQAIEGIPYLERAFRLANMNPGSEALGFRVQSSLGGLLLTINHPLTGVGYAQAVSHYVELLPHWATSPNHPSLIHNSFLEISAELGLFALLLFIGLWIRAFQWLKAAWHHQDTRIYAKVMVAILAGQFAFMMITPMMREIWLTLAMSMVLGRIVAKNLGAETRPSPTNRGSERPTLLPTPLASIPHDSSHPNRV